jgi:putative transposase
LAGLGAASGGDRVRDEIQRQGLEHHHDGYCRITVLLKRSGFAVNHKRVQRIRAEDNLLCVPKQAFRPATTDSRHRFVVYPNLARRLVPTAVNPLWIADITYVRLSEEFIYLAVVLDALSRRVIGWGLADHLRAGLALEALEMALSARQALPGLVHHSDRGVQYACGDYIQRLEWAGIQLSMSRPGCPWDNAMAESFMRTLKREEVDGRAYRELDDARSLIATFFEAIYNRQRLRSALAYLAPEAYEASPPALARSGAGS